MRHVHYRRGPSPIALFVFSILLFWLFGFKFFFFLPLLFLFGGFSRWSQCGLSHHEYDWTTEKPKRKSKPKQYHDIDDDSDDITYV